MRRTIRLLTCNSLSVEREPSRNRLLDTLVIVVRAELLLDHSASSSDLLLVVAEAVPIVLSIFAFLLFLIVLLPEASPASPTLRSMRRLAAHHRRESPMGINGAKMRG